MKVTTVDEMSPAVHQTAIKRIQKVISAAGKALPSDLSALICDHRIPAKNPQAAHLIRVSGPRIRRGTPGHPAYLAKAASAMPRPRSFCPAALASVELIE
ncbi:hypothetical protein GCM10018953_16620 [Streptosporangium nondiastaticum]